MSVPPNAYIVGQVVLFQDVITNQRTGALTDDSTETVTFFRPDGTSIAGAGVSHDGLGTYSIQFAPDQPGWWQYEFMSTNGATGRGRSNFYVASVP